MKKISISIVLYKNDSSINLAIDPLLSTSFPIELYLIDNSPTDELREIVKDPRVKYIFNNANLGYGAGHNIALNLALKNNCKYHLVMNPDIVINDRTLEVLYQYMEKNHDVGQVMPKVYYPNGELQRLCKLLPTPFDLFGRRFLRNMPGVERRNKNYEMHDFDYKHELNSPSLSGCFMFLRTDVLRITGLFDTRYFMYLEDYDLTRRIHKVSKTIFYPHSSIVHGYQMESYKNKQLLKAHLLSAIKYFNKWGWFYDKERTNFNNRVLDEIRNLRRYGK